MKIRGLRILILCQDREAFEGVEVYMAHKGTYVQITQSTEKFLSHLKDFNPNYTIVSIDHEDPYVPDLIRKLNELNQPPVIPTTESQGIEKSAELDEFEIEHTFFPPISGKKLENILKFLETKKEKEVKSINYEREEKVHTEVTLNIERLEELKQDYKEIKKELDKNSDVEILKKAINYELGEDDSTLSEVPDDSDELTDESQVKDPAEISYNIRATNVFSNALASISKSKVIDTPESLGSVKKFTAYSIVSESLKGYMFSIMEDFESVSETIAQTIDGRLVQALTEEIDGVFEIHRIKMDIEAFDFKHWIESTEGAMSSFAVDDNVVTWGFVTNHSNSVEFLPNDEDEEMVGVDLSEIQPEQRIKNDLYLHMPKNGRFILYTRKDGHLLDDQFTKLKSCDVEKLHLKKEDISSFKDYKVEKDIRNMVKKHKKAS